MHRSPTRNTFRYKKKSVNSSIPLCKYSISQIQFLSLTEWQETWNCADCCFHVCACVFSAVRKIKGILQSVRRAEMLQYQSEDSFHANLKVLIHIQACVFCTLYAIHLSTNNVSIILYVLIVLNIFRFLRTKSKLPLFAPTCTFIFSKHREIIL